MSKIGMALFIVMAVLSTASYAVSDDTRYVTDRLLLSMYALPSPSSEVITRLRSGDILTEIERQGRFTKVSTDSGKVGWVKQVFLVQEKPAVLIVSQTKAETARIKLELKKLKSNKNSPAKLLSQIKTLKNKIELEESNLKKVMENEELLSIENNAFKNARSNEKNTDLMIWALFVLLGMSIGFFAGYKVLEIKVKKRFCGLKVW